jgi:hypothetical protein
MAYGNNLGGICPKCKKGTMHVKLIYHPERREKLEHLGLADDPEFWDD